MTGQTTDSSVFALISAFTSGLDVFKKLKKKRKRKGDPVDTEEARLSLSLKRGPTDIQQEYSKNYSIQGERYREGDSKAHASLAAVLLKLNNGLVSIISTFLSGGKKGGKTDYERLTALSESSRMEAIDALSQLSYRLSQSSLTLLRPTAGLDKSARKKATKKKDERYDSNTALIRRTQMSNASSPQLAIIKPRAKRTHSGTSSKSSQSRTPPPPYQTSSPSPRPSNRSTPNLASPQILAGGRVPMPTNLSTPLHSPPIHYTVRPDTSNGGRDPLEELQRRRAEKMTPSLYTFASDSTKLGEIPMSRWPQPYDWEESNRLNKLAADGLVDDPRIPVRKQRRGFLSMFRRGNTENCSAGLGKVIDSQRTNVDKM